MSVPPTGPESQGAGAPPPYGQPPYGQPPYGQPSDAPPTYGGAPAPGYGQQPPLSDSDRRMWAMLAHLSGILFAFIGPLVIFLIYKDRDEFVKDQSMEALNFQITITIVYFIGSILSLVYIGLFILLAAWVAVIVFGILAGLAANKGERYRYPFALRLVK